MEDCIIGLFLMIFAYFDLKKREIPMQLVLVGGGLAILCLACNIYFIETSVLSGFAGMLPGGLMLLLAYFTKQVGAGDGITIGLIGLCKGMRICVCIVCMSLLLVSIVGILLLLIHRAEKDTRLPFLPFLCAAFWVWKIMPL